MGTGPFVVRKAGLELDGRSAGTLLGYEGARGSSDLTFRCGAGMSREFYDWLSASFGQRHDRRHGAISTSDQRLEFLDGLVTAVVFPELDRSAKVAASMTVKVLSERSTFSPSPPPALRPPKPWLASDFRLRIDGLESACKQVTRIAAVSMTTKIALIHTGRDRFPVSEPKGTGFSNLVIEIPTLGPQAPEASELVRWAHGSVEMGRATEPKAGSLEYLSPGGGGAYYRIGFSGLGIVAFTSLSRAKARIEMYSESMSFTALPSAILP